MTGNVLIKNRTLSSDVPYLFGLPKQKTTLLRHTSVLRSKTLAEGEFISPEHFNFLKGIQKRSHNLCCDFFFWSGRRGSNSLPPPWQGGALPDELRPRIAQRLLRNGASGRNRTNDTRIFSPLLYQLSYRGISSRYCSLIMATTKGLEPSTSGVTGRRSNQLNYMATFWWEQQGSNL